MVCPAFCEGKVKAKEMTNRVNIQTGVPGLVADDSENYGLLFYAEGEPDTKVTLNWFLKKSVEDGYTVDALNLIDSIISPDYEPYKKLKNNILSVMAGAYMLNDRVQ